MAGILSLFAWLSPVLGRLLLPVQYLNTHLHELGHALAAALTGGTVEQIIVRADGSGVTPVAGGALVILGSAGYVGASIAGSIMIAQARSEKAALVVLKTLAVILAGSMLLWVRGDPVGIATGILWTLALWTGGIYLRGNAAIFAAQFLGLQQMLAAIHSVYQLLRISAFTEVQSDARLLQDSTGVPAMAWAAGWCLISFSLLAVALRRAWGQHPSRSSMR